MRVIAVTPHSPRIRANPPVSAAWQIVEQWNTAVDDDGTPFRDKIFAVFPGFEPSLNQGKSGLHLLFIFDPEIGRENYFKAFDLVMGGVSPWNDTDLQLSNKSVLLSLLLQTRDDRRLVIDQPEDELDNRFLFDTVLPALNASRDVARSSLRLTTPTLS